MLMTQYVGGGAENVPQAGAHFARGLAQYDIAGVVLRNSGQAIEARRILAERGFERKLHAIDYDLWVRP